MVPALGHKAAAQSRPAGKNLPGLFVGRFIYLCRHLGLDLLLGLLGGVVNPEIMLRRLVALACGPNKPAHGFLHILGHATTCLITKPEIALGRGNFLFSSGAIPSHSFFKILWDNVTLFVEYPEIELRLRFPAICGRMIPFYGFRVILRHALAGFVKNA